MKYSIFNDYIADFPQKGNLLIYNSLRENFLLLHPQKKETILIIHDKNAILSDELSKKQLADTRMLIDNKADEIKAVREKFKVIQNNRLVRSYGLIMTYGCNLRCRFCSQEVLNSDKKVKFEKNIKQKTVDWIANGADGFSNINVHFYGGEPLIHPELIFFYTEQIKKRLPDKQINFGITTNGTLINKKLLEKLYNAGVQSFLVGMVGMAKSHNRLRPYINGRGSFHEVCRNLESLPEYISIDLNIHYSGDTQDELMELLIYLKDSGIRKNVGTIEITPLVNVDHNGTRICTLSDSDLSIFSRLHKFALSNGYKLRHNFRIGPCHSVVNRHSVLIDPSGNLYKCYSLLGESRFCIGDIFTQSPDNDFSQYELYPWENDEECMNCPYLPICGGGCRFAAFLATGKHNGKACEKRFFSTLGKEEFKSVFFINHFKHILKSKGVYDE